MVAAFSREMWELPKTALWMGRASLESNKWKWSLFDVSLRGFRVGFTDCSIILIDGGRAIDTMEL